MQKVYKAQDYFLAFLVTLGCALFILYPVNDCPFLPWSTLFKYSLLLHPKAGEEC